MAVILSIWGSVLPHLAVFTAKNSIYCFESDKSLFRVIIDKKYK